MTERPPIDSTEERKYLATEPEQLSSARVLRAGAWALGLRGAQRVVSLVRLVILARVLAPSDFGQMGVALLALSILTTFTETGMSAALVQREGEIEQHLDTAWTVGILRKVGVVAVLLILAPVAAAFFDDPSATPIVRGVAVGFLLAGFQNIGIVYFERDLEFAKRFAFGFIGLVVDGGVAIVLAVVLKSAWALVWGFIAASIVSVGLSYVLHPYRPRLRIERESFRLLYRFGRWIYGLRVLAFITLEGDDLVVGRMLGTNALGLYQVSYRLTNLPATEVIETLAAVLFPSYARLQSEPDRAKRAFLLGINATSLLAFPLIAGLASLASPLVRFVLGDGWEPTIPVIRWLAVFVAFRILARSIGTLFTGIGRPDVATKFRLLQAIVFAALVVPLTDRLGMAGAAIAVVIGIAVGQALALHRLHKLLGIAPLPVFRAGRVALLASGLLAGLLLVLEATVISNLGTLILASALGFGAYVATSYLLGRMLGGGPQHVMAALRAARAA